MNFSGYRIFRGSETRQIDGVTAEKADPKGWYFEPEDYEGDVLFSQAFRTRGAALDGITRHCKGGRPNTSKDGAARGATLKVRLSPAEKARIEDLADEAKLDVSAYVRAKLL